MTCPPHHYMIPGGGGYVDGVCKRCGDVKVHLNTFEYERIRRPWRSQQLTPKGEPTGVYGFGLSDYGRRGAQASRKARRERMRR